MTPMDILTWRETLCSGPGQLPQNSPDDKDHNENNQTQQGGIHDSLQKEYYSS